MRQELGLNVGQRGKKETDLWRLKAGHWKHVPHKQKCGIRTSESHKYLACFLFMQCGGGLLCCPRELAAGAKGHYIPANNSASFFHNDFYSPHISTGSFHIYHCLMYLSCTPVAKWNTVLF